jgi:hypothetical protein
MIQWGMVGYFEGEPITLCFALKLSVLVLGLLSAAGFVAWLIAPAESRNTQEKP